MSATLDQLRAFHAVVTEGSFAAAGKKLHRVPSAITYLIQGLEEQLGISLFEKDGRRSVLSEAGRNILEHAGEVLEASERLEKRVEQLRDGWEPELLVVVDGALPQQGLIRSLRRFAEPDVPTRLRLEVEYQEGVIDRFHSMRAHLGLCLGFRGDGDERGFECRPLRPLEFVLVARWDHPLAKGHATIERRIPHAELITRDSSPKFQQIFKPSFEGSKTTVFLSDFYSKRAALIGGAGYGWIPRHFVQTDLEEGVLVLLDAEPHSWLYEPQIISRKGEILGRGARLFMEHLNNEV